MLYCLSSGYRFIKSYTFLQSSQASPVFQRVIDCLTSCFFSIFVFPSLRPQSVQRWQKKTFAKFVIYWFAIGDKFAVRGISFPSDCAWRLMDFLAHFFCVVSPNKRSLKRGIRFLFSTTSQKLTVFRPRLNGHHSDAVVTFFVSFFFALCQNAKCSMSLSHVVEVLSSTFLFSDRFNR